MFGISNAGDERAVLLRRLYARGRAIIAADRVAAGYGMTWYGALEEADPLSRRVVLAANPALREGLLSWEGVEAERESLTPDAFQRERLNVLADRPRDAGWIGDGILERQAAPDREVSVTECRPLAMSVDASWGWTRATIRVAATMPDGRPGPCSDHRRANRAPWRIGRARRPPGGGPPPGGGVAAGRPGV